MTFILLGLLSGFLTLETRITVGLPSALLGTHLASLLFASSLVGTTTMKMGGDDNDDNDSWKQRDGWHGSSWWSHPDEYYHGYDDDWQRKKYQKTNDDAFRRHMELCQLQRRQSDVGSVGTSPDVGPVGSISAGFVPVTPTGNPSAGLARVGGAVVSAGASPAGAGVGGAAASSGASPAGASGAGAEQPNVVVLADIPALANALAPHMQQTIFDTLNSWRSQKTQSLRLQRVSNTPVVAQAAAAAPAASASDRNPAVAAAVSKAAVAAAADTAAVAAAAKDVPGNADGDADAAAASSAGTPADNHRRRQADSSSNSSTKL